MSSSTTTRYYEFACQVATIPGHKYKVFATANGQTVTEEKTANNNGIVAFDTPWVNIASSEGMCSIWTTETYSVAVTFSLADLGEPSA